MEEWKKGKQAQTREPLHPLLAGRWSPRAFKPAIPEPGALVLVLEAARWAPSCYNEQPWRFIVGIKGDETWKTLSEILKPGNRTWALEAPVLILLAAKKTFTHNGRPNRHHAYDAGQAAAMLTVQAQAQGLYVHQMAGFSPEDAEERLNIPADFEPMTVMALGMLGDPDGLPDDLRERELTPRERMPLSGLAFGGRWGEPLR